MQINKAAFTTLTRQIPADLAAALRCYLNAKVYVELLRPISEEIQAAAMAKFKPVVVPFISKGKAYPELDENVGQLITKWSELYRASDDVAHAMYRFSIEQFAARGFTEDNPDKCPFLVAESMYREARNVFIDEMAEVLGVQDVAKAMLIEHKEEFVDLTLNFLVPIAVEQGLDLSVMGSRPE